MLAWKTSRVFKAEQRLWSSLILAQTYWQDPRGWTFFIVLMQFLNMSISLLVTLLGWKKSICICKCPCVTVSLIFWAVLTFFVLKLGFFCAWGRCWVRHSTLPWWEEGFQGIYWWCSVPFSRTKGFESFVCLLFHWAIISSQQFLCSCDTHVQREDGERQEEKFN